MTLTIFDFAVGLALPFIVKACDKYLPKNSTLKYLAILGTSALFGAVIAYADGRLSLDDAFGSFVTIATTSQTVYVAFLKSR